MSAGILREFLVALGYKVDQASERRFVEGVNNATSVVKTLGKAVEALAVGGAAYAAVRWFDKMTGGMEQLYYAAKRAGGSVKELQAFGYAASQMGSSFEQATSSAQAMYQWLRNNPNAPALLLNNLGVNARNPDGSLISGASALQQVGQRLAGMPGYRQKQYADLLGIPLELRNALVQSGEFGGFESQFIAKQRAAGLDPDAAAEKGRNFQRVVRSVVSSFGVVSDKVVSSLLGQNGIGKSIERFQNALVARAPQIAEILKWLVDVIGPMIVSFIDWLSKLSASDITNGLKAFAVALAALVALKIGGMVASVAALAGPAGLPALAIALGAMVAVMKAYDIAKDLHLNPKDSKGYDPSNQLADFILHDKLFSDALTGGPKAREAYKRYLDEKNRQDALPKNEFGLPVDMSKARQVHPQSPSRGGQANANPQDFLRSLEQQWGLPAGLLDSVWNQESGRGAHMLSPKGAMGHFQFMPKTAALYGVSNPNDFAQSATGAAHLLANLLRSYGGNLDFALAAYNWGEKNLNTKGLDHAPRETQEYIRRIRQMMDNPYRAEHGAHGAPTAAAKHKDVNIKSETNIHVHGAGEPVAVAAAVSQRQDEANKRLARNFRQVWA